MAHLDVHRIPARKDNYIWLAVEPEDGAVAVIDPADAEPVIDRLDRLGLSLTHILNTHHHGDHTGGNLALKERYGCTIVGSRMDRHRIPGIDIALGDGDRFRLGRAEAEIFDVTGHTIGHIMYWFPASRILFCGDTLFAMGCGRLSEGTAAQMWTALSRFRALPDEATIYCAHEYTEANARFARTIEPDNAALKAREARVKAQRARGEATVPFRLGEEWATNPFLRSGEMALKEAIGMKEAAAVDVFAETRRRKDRF